MARRVLLWLACLAMALVCLEGSARLVLRVAFLADRVMAGDSTAYRLRWLSRHADEGRHTKYPFDEWSPTLGWTLKPGLRETFRGKPLSSNSRGVRGRREFDYAKPAGAFRIVVLGDSFSFGEGVGDDETWSQVLQERLPQSEVLNLAVHGYGHDQMLIRLEEEGLRYQPDLVLLGFLPIDNGRNLLAFRDFAKPRFVLREGELVLTHSPVPTVEQVLAAERFESRFLDLIRMIAARYRARTGEALRETNQLTLAILDRIAARSQAAGARPVFAYLPAFQELALTDPAKTADERFFFDYCQQRGIPAIHLRPYFRPALANGAKLAVSYHWGPSEHRIAGEGIAAELVARQLAPGGA